MIPPRENGSLWHRPSPGAGPTCLEDVGGYHRRSLVETKMHGFKRLGERQVVRLPVRVALPNRFSMA